MLTSKQLIMLAIVAFISAFGGFVQWIRKEDDMRTRTELVKTISTGVFTGVLVFVALTTIEMDTMIRYVVSGLTSYLGGTVLDMSAHMATKVAERKLGICTEQGANAEQLDAIANLAFHQNQSLQTPQPQPQPIPPETPVQIRPGEVALAAYEAEGQIQLVAEKPKRKRAPRKKKVEEVSPSTTNSPTTPQPLIDQGSPVPQQGNQPAPATGSNQQ